MQNIAAALAEAGAEMGDAVRVRYILPDRKDFEKTWYVKCLSWGCSLQGGHGEAGYGLGIRLTPRRPVLQKWLGDVRPAATMIQAGLMEEAMKIEIEVTAKKGGVVGEQAGLL
jgi:enamine deaminase RidA (YjgF/YER057c/UK114 family)